MEPSAISYPFRKIFRGKKNIRFRLATLKKVVPNENKIILSNGELYYDILILSTGAETNFFGNKNIEQNALPMKTISDALTLRNLIYTRLEHATRTDNSELRKKLLTFVIAGAGPTGVELSGIFAEMKRNILNKDYPELHQEDFGEIFLVDGQNMVLSPMSKKAQQYTFVKLKELGVNIKLNIFVKDFVDDVVYFSDDTKIESRNLIWTAGIKAKTFEGFEKKDFGRGSRLITDAFNKVKAYENIFALGDTALLEGDKNYPDGHPQVAQPAIQQAINLGKNLSNPQKLWKPFRYRDKGSLAIIGINKAVLDGSKGKYFVSGFFAWFVWVFVHIMSLVNFRNRVRALYDWIGYYISKDQSFRMIIKPHNKEDD